LSHIRLLAALMAICLTVGCKAQPAANAPADAAMSRRIEVMVRSQYNLPPDFDIAIGDREKSRISGYDTLPVSISHGGRSQTIDFLLSTDGKTLARLDTIDLVKNPAFSIDIANRPLRGNPEARVTVISFDDLECPYCGKMHKDLFPATLMHYGDKVRFVYKDFPLVEIHPWAMRAAIDANCLAAQNHDVYWNYVDYIHSHGDEVSGQDRDVAKSHAALDRIARQMAAIGNLDTGKLAACLTAQDETQIKASMNEARELSIDGAPALFIDGERINGALPAEQVWLVIDRALRAAGITPPPMPEAPKPATQQPSAQ
jgi:protein-disulfide isomerase